MPTDHAWQDCPNTQRVENLEHWQERQDSHIEGHDSCLLQLKAAEARRAGAESMLKWVLGFAITGAVSGVVGLIVNLQG